MTSSSSSKFYIDIVGLRDIKLKGSISFWKIKTASPINLKSKGSKTLAGLTEIRDGLPRALEAPARLRATLGNAYLPLQESKINICLTQNLGPPR